ncbi:hypothetical protein WICANDRAFT_53747 [Wickerhamomyces anomalus NRRL Y-366-8]|uniref:Transcription factor MBP1 n=1 Tax=Wickerhamomyces anomalus (strain ATCC 58044 / CBS 1984 / NCYC 433 / NRRL Y-366-8) TaxID=683960 RepID=A0A1E3P3T2_WICAA|nr:uncharacterized protein WICANDRAFT_53747 [Wickerhamomyces anomalus NRRL Y-366-8]ODQ60075.1 hypothetical protein WICANDRAFT_53747 [Wickerhamomyces anomalus NRRL Y-366-8]
MDKVYSATYSGVAVYELVNVTGSVMRRRSDGWVNATHILKTANFPKAKRTRILERDVQTGEHEKVQGGYGKYQGTWVPLSRARDIAAQFGVEEVLAPLFNLESSNGANSPPPAPKHHHASKNNSMTAGGVEKPSSNKKVAARKIASMPVGINKDLTPASALTKKRGRPRRSPNQKVNQSARESLEKAIYSHAGNIRNINATDKWYDSNSEYTARLLEYFAAPDDDDTHESKVPDFLLHPPEGLNVDQSVDDEGHTAFHWACSMGNLQAAEALINLGANYRAVNNSGETPLMRAVMFTNSYTRKSFSRLVGLLSETIMDVDSTHKTVLHHIAAAATSKVRVPSALYYMDILLAKLAESQRQERLQGYLNLQDNSGDTALHLCAKNGNRKCIKLLLDYKAKTNLKNNQGLIASDILLSNENITPKVQQRYETHLRNQRVASQVHSAFNRVAQPHISEAAIEASHKVTEFMAESLNELSNAFDYELQRKEADVSEVQELLNNMNEEIRLISLKTSEFLNEKLDEKQLENRVKIVQDQVKRYESLVITKEVKLGKLIERSQAKSLAKLVKKQEDAPKTSEATNDDQFQDAVELTTLQLNRKKEIEEIIHLYSGIDGSNEKMLKYKRLISACSDVEIDQVSNKVDELLQEIEKGLYQ